MTTEDAEFSPNQLAKRSMIVDAGVETIKREGIAGCTVRGIAMMTPFTKSGIQYYFPDSREIVNAAYLRMTENYVAAVSVVADEEKNPLRSFWVLTASYLEPFEAHPRMTLLWFEYTSWAGRHGFWPELAASVGSIRQMFASRLAAIGGRQEQAAAPLVRYLLGAILDLGTSVVTFEEAFSDVARICGLAPPRRGRIAVDHDSVCPLCRMKEPTV